MKQALVGLVVAMLVVPAMGVGITFSENYDSYISGSAPGGPWQVLSSSPFVGSLVATSSYVVSGKSYLVGNSGYAEVDKGNYAMLVGAGEELQYSAVAPLTLQYDAKAATAKQADFYVELSKGDVHAPRMQDLGVGVPNPGGVLPVVAYCKPVAATAGKALYFFDGLQWLSAGSLDTNAVTETIMMTLDGSGADFSSTGQAYTDITLNYTGGFDRVNTYTRDHTWTTAAVIDNLSVTGGDLVPVPEPTTLILLGLGGLFIRRRRA